MKFFSSREISLADSGWWTRCNLKRKGAGIAEFEGLRYIRKPPAILSHSLWRLKKRAAWHHLIMT